MDHTNSNSTKYKSQQWTQRYYESAQHFQGPGSPIFLILGGEGAIQPETGLFYPFVSDRLARAFGAFVLEPEHRYYGESIPVNVTSANSDPRETLLTPEQALYDAVRLTRHIQDLLLCSRDKTSPLYCPVISVGGSYPGFLSAMARLRFPDAVDMAYAASAPIKFYAQQVHAHEYYDHISHVAEMCKPGCAHAVRTTLESLGSEFAPLSSRKQVEDAAASLGFCPESVPSYMTNREIFQTELFMIVGYTFANDNMAYYPPDNRTKLYKSCFSFLDDKTSPRERTKDFLVSHFSQNNNCIDMSLQLPTGPNATISGGDWSGVGTGADGESWDFQTCTLLVEAIEFSNVSMFPTRPWTREWLFQHCQSRFHVSPQPNSLASQWHFDNLVETNASRILFTNGLNDGWSVGSILSNISDTLISLNFKNGAHHSDLSHQGPSEDDTDDVRQGFNTIQSILGEWLDDIRALSKLEETKQGELRANFKY